MRIEHSLKRKGDKIQDVTPTQLREMNVASKNLSRIREMGCDCCYLEAYSCHSMYKVEVKVMTVRVKCAGLYR